MTDLLNFPGTHTPHTPQSSQSRVIKAVAFVDSSLDPSTFAGLDESGWDALVTAERMILVEGIRGTWPEEQAPLEGPSSGYLESVTDGQNNMIGISDYSPDANETMWQRLEFQSRLHNWSVIIIFKDNNAFYPYIGAGLHPVTITKSRGVIGKSIVMNVRLMWNGKLLGKLTDFVPTKCT